VIPPVPRFAVGEEYSGRPKVISVARTRAAAGGPWDAPEWPFKDLHTDDEIARKSGFPGQIGVGSALHGYVIQLMTVLFGTRWLSHGALDVRYLRPILVGDVVTARARVTRRDDDAIGLDVWVTDQNGNTMMAGRATFSAGPSSA
jgi:acyl dehydratase